MTIQTLVKAAVEPVAVQEAPSDDRIKNILNLWSGTSTQHVITLLRNAFAPPLPVAPKAEQAATQAEAKWTKCDWCNNTGQAGRSGDPCYKCKGAGSIAPTAPTGAQAEPEYRIFKDGDQWCAVGRGFIDLQQSPAGFSDTPAEALNQLMKEFGKAWAAKNGEWVKSHSAEPNKRNTKASDFLRHHGYEWSADILDKALKGTAEQAAPVLLRWVISNLLTEGQLDVVPPGTDKPLRFWEKS